MHDSLEYNFAYDVKPGHSFGLRDYEVTPERERKNEQASFVEKSGTRGDPEIYRITLLSAVPCSGC